uniref:DENN domain containing 3 n=1 Tax=Seriola dumerili TaxID=41447 RepID=A0A3B4TXD8_SERDU
MLSVLIPVLSATQAVNNNGGLEHLLLEPEVLHVLAPPFVSRPQNECEVVRPRGKRRRSFLRRKREQPPSAAAAAATQSQGLVPACLVWYTHEQFHFLVFTDVFGNKSHGVVMQCYRPILVHSEGMSSFHNGTGSSKFSTVFSAFSFCVISKYPYFTALKDCLSVYFVVTCPKNVYIHNHMCQKLVDIRAPTVTVYVFQMFTLRPLTIVLPSSEDKDHPAIDLDLHLPFLCFRPQQLLQVMSCLLQEQRVVLFSSDWARLTLVAESLLLFLQPLSWQQPYVPVLARGMLDFLMAPTAFLMGCHLSHFEEVAAETDDLILINIDSGSVSTSCSDTVDLPNIPPAAADCFTQRSQSLQIHFDLDQCHHNSCTDINEQRAHRRAWQQNLNHDIQRITLEMIVNIFRDVSCHLNYEHRVFNSEEFLKTREPAEQLFYKKVLETYIFHSFLKDRLNRKIDNYARMELSTRSEIGIYPILCLNLYTGVQTSGNKQFNISSIFLAFLVLSSSTSSSPHPPLCLCPLALRTPPKPVKVFKLPDFPASLSFHSVQSYYSELIQQLGKAIFSVQNENSTLLARFYYLRGFINTLCSRRLDALSDFQNLYKTDTAIFPTQLLTWLVDSLHRDERQQADRRPELKRLILKPDDHVKNFELPRKHLHQDDFVRCVQECGIVKDVATIHRLFDALTDGQPKQVDPDLFRVFYTFWKETEAEAQDVNLPTEVIDHLDNSECVYKLSSCVKTSHGVGKIAMTQKRLFLLTEGQPGYFEITKFRDIQDVKIASAPFLLVRIPSLRIQTSGRPEVFEANLKTETELWNLVVKEMWAGRKMADQHKDPQYMTQALTNVLLMDAVMGCVQTQRSIIAASKLAYFDKIKHEVPMMVPKTTSETLKHKINPSLDLAEPQTVHVLLYTPGTIWKGEMNPKLWVALSGGKVVVFDAASWSMLQDCIQVGESKLNCMLGLVQEQVWIGSQDSVIYIIDTHSMSCNKQLTEHRHEVTGLTRHDGLHFGHQLLQQTYSCSSDGMILQWDSASLKVKRQLHLSCDRLSSIQIHDGTLWCCKYTSLPFLFSNLKLLFHVHFYLVPSSFSSFIVMPERGQLWTGCVDSGELCLWHTHNHRHLSKRIPLPGSSGVTCMIRVKDQIWVGCRGRSGVGGHCDGHLRSQVLVVDPESHTVAKELQAHSDSIQTLCSAEDRYVLSGSARRDGKIAIWKVE